MSGPITFASPLSDYRDHMGAVLLWRFPLARGERPVVGVPAGMGMTSFFTHFTEIIIPRLVPTQ